MMELPPYLESFVEDASARMAGERQHHAYLFLGLEDAGRQGVLSELARRRLGLSDADQALEKVLMHPAVHRLEPNDKGKIVVDQVRGLNQKLQMKAAHADLHVVLCTSTGAMNAQAQNALLKTLEEPPGPTCFLLGAGQRTQLLPTVISRVQSLRIPGPDLEWMKESWASAGFNIDDTSLLARVYGPYSESYSRAAGLSVLWGLLNDVASGALREFEVLKEAQAIAGDKDKGKIQDFWAVCEVWARDAWATAYDSKSEGGGGIAKSISILERFSQRIDAYRREKQFNPNIQIRIENVLLALCTPEASS